MQVCTSLQTDNHTSTPLLSFYRPDALPAAQPTVSKHWRRTHTQTRLTALCSGPPGWASTRKVKPSWILLKQETVSGSRIRWAICKSAPHSRQITMPAPHCSIFYRPDALPAAQPTASKHWRNKHYVSNITFNLNQLLLLHYTRLTAYFPGQPK